jgi:TolB-like protein
VGGMGRSLSFGRYRLDLDTNVLRRGAEPIAIGSRCVTLLRVLLDARGELVSKATLLRAGWSGLTVAESNLTVQIAALRRLLDDKLIATVPRSGYRFTGKITESNMATRTADKIAVAILPITNVGSDPKERYFGDGVTREVITALSRFADLSVIAANSSLRFRDRAVDAHEAQSELGVQYIGTVAVQRVGQQVRISAQLIDTETRAHLWAERYDRHMRDVFSMQDEVAGQIAGVLVAHVARAEREKLAQQPAEALRAYDYYLRALDHSRLWDRSDATAAERMLERAIELAPGYGAAHAALTNYLISSWLEPKDGRWGDPATLDRAWIAARTAVQRDPVLPAAHAALGWVQCWRHELESAVASYKHAQELNPSFADGHHGHVLGIAGMPEKGLDTLHRTKRLDPFHPPMLLGYIGHCHLLLGQAKQALVVLRECTTQAPGWRPGHVWHAAACARLKLDDQARAAAAEVTRIHPGFTVSAWQRMHGYRDPRRANIIGKNLIQAGLPRGCRQHLSDDVVSGCRAGG